MSSSRASQSLNRDGRMASRSRSLPAEAPCLCAVPAPQRGRQVSESDRLRRRQVPARPGRGQGIARTYAERRDPAASRRMAGRRRLHLAVAGHVGAGCRAHPPATLRLPASLREALQAGVAMRAGRVRLQITRQRGSRHAIQPRPGGSTAPQFSIVLAARCKCATCNRPHRLPSLHQMGAKKHLTAFLTATLTRIPLIASLLRQLLACQRVSGSGKGIRVRVARKCTVKCPLLNCSF
jgi:hypothetical protein